MDSDAGMTIDALLGQPRLQPISYASAHARLIKLNRINDEWAKKSGKRGAWVVSPSGFEVLCRLRELEASGVSVDAGLEIITSELCGPTSGRPLVEAATAEALRSDTTARELEMLRERITDLEYQRDDLRSERDRLLALLERTAIPLPAPPRARRRWWKPGRS